MFSSAVETETGEKAAKEEAVVENTTPDYAAGLVSAQVLHSHHPDVPVLSHITPSLTLPAPVITYNVFFSFPESSAVNQLPTSHTQHGSLLLLHSQLRGTARLDTQRCVVSTQCFHASSCLRRQRKLPCRYQQSIKSISQCLSLLHSKCWWFRTGHTAVSPSTRGVSNSRCQRQRHLTWPVQTEDAHVQREQHGQSCNPHVPQHASLHPRQ